MFDVDPELLARGAASTVFPVGAVLEIDGGAVTVTLPACGPDVTGTVDLPGFKICRDVVSTDGGWDGVRVASSVSKRCTSSASSCACACQAVCERVCTPAGVSEVRYAMFNPTPATCHTNTKTASRNNLFN